MATRNSSARSSSTPSARAGSRRTSVSAVLRVLNRKCGRMRDCSSARRAVVSAGTVALARRRSQTKIAAAIAAPASGGPKPTSAPKPAAAASASRLATSRDVTAAANAPKPIAAHPLHHHRRLGERQLQRAQREQPGEHRRQRDARAGGDERQPDRHAGGGEDHADRHRAVHEQQRAQHDADVADVERRVAGRSRRATSAGAMSNDGRAEAGRDAIPAASARRS